jgi:hypothetical protein
MGFLPSASAAVVSDLAAANELAQNGIIVDYTANTAGYRLNDNILRQEAVKVVAGVLGGIIENEATYTCTGMFSDIENNTWVCRIAELSRNAGLVHPNPTFRPTAKLSRLEGIIFALRAADIMPAGDHSSSEILGYAVDAGLITSAAGFNTNTAITRGEFFRFIVNALDAAEMPDLCTIAPDLCGGTVTPPTTGGAVSVSAATSQPSGTLVACQAGAKILDVVVSGNGTLASLTLARTGYSTNSDLSNIYVYDGATRLTSGYSFNTNGVLVMNNLNIAVAGSKTLSVRADVACSTSGAGVTSGNTIGVAVTSYTVAGSAATTASVSGTVFPIANVGLAAVTMTSTSPSPAAATINAGTTATTVWSHNFSVSTRNVNFKGLLARMIGSAPVNALANVQLVIDGTVVATATPDAGGYMYFAPAATTTLTTGGHTFEIRANVVAGSNRNFYVVAENASDIMLEDSNYPGVNVLVTAASVAVSNVTGGTMTINPGTLTISQTPTTTTTVIGGSSNTVIGTYKFQAYGEDVKVNTLTLNVEGTAGAPTTLVAGGLRNVSLFVNGAQVGSSANLSGVAVTPGTAVTFASLGSNLIVPAGQAVTVEVKADIMNSSSVAYTSGTLKTTIAAGTSNAQGQSSMALVSTSAASGQTYTINSTNATYAKSSGFVAQSVSPNSSSVKIGSFVLQTGNAEGVTVNNISVALSGTMALTNLSNLTVKDGSTVIGNPIGVASATNNFSVSGITLPASSSKTFDIYADLGSTTGVNITANSTATYRGSVSNISTTSATITGVTTTVGVAALTASIQSASVDETAQYVIGGGVLKKIVTYKVVSTNNIPATVTRMVITSTGADTIQSVKIGGVTATISGTAPYTADVSGLAIAVPGTPAGVSIPVEVVYSCFVGGNVGTGCNLTNSPVTPRAAGIQIAAATDIEAQSGGTVIYPVLAATPLVSQSMSLVASKPTITVPNTNNSGLVNAEVKIGEVTIAADAAGNIEVTQIPFNFALNGAVAPTISACRIAEGSTTVPGSSFSACAAGAANAIFATAQTITAGSSKTYSVYATVAGVTGAANTVSISSNVNTPASFLWNDIIGGGVGLTGAAIYSYPTGSYTVHN